MKRSPFILIFFIFLSINLFGQECYPVSEKTFEELEKRIKKAKTDERRLLLSENIVLGKCFTSSQIGDLISQFDSDNMRAKFLKKYLHTITDLSHISAVFNSFDDMAMVLTTYEKLRPSILLEMSGGVTTAMSDTEFAEKFSFVEAEQYHRDKQERIRHFFEFETLTLTQIDSLVRQFKYTRDQKWVLRLLYERCSEKNRYYQFAGIFDYERDREELLAFIN